MDLKKTKLPRSGLSNYKRLAIRAAEDLGYSNEVIAKIKTLTDENSISRLMTSARANDGKLIND